MSENGWKWLADRLQTAEPNLRDDAFLGGRGMSITLGMVRSAAAAQDRIEELAAQLIETVNTAAIYVRENRKLEAEAQEAAATITRLRGLVQKIESLINDGEAHGIASWSILTAIQMELDVFNAELEKP